MNSLINSTKMPFTGKICKRGLWDESVPGITFDKEGISNYAYLNDKLVKAYPRGEQGQKEWLNIVELIKKKGRNKRYDCIVGVSGGTDSSYLLYVAKEYGLRPLAVNLDNGWSSDISVKNIKKVTNALQIDLETYVINYEEIKELLKSYMYACLPWIDIPSDLAIKAVLYKIASRENIKFILRGNDFRSEGSQPREWTYGDGKQLKAVYKKFGNVKLVTFPNYTINSMLFYAVLKQIKSIYPFYYLEYNKATAQRFLEQHYGWEYYGGHHHENIFTKFAISYWMYEKFGIDKRKITLSAQVLNGQLLRDEALAIIKEKPFNPITITKTIDYVIKKLDMTEDEFKKLIKNSNKSYKDYPYYRLLLKNLKFLSGNVFKFIFYHKPQSVFQTEIRDFK